MMEQAVDVMMMSEVVKTRQVCDTNKIIQVWWRETLHHTKRQGDRAVEYASLCQSYRTTL